MKTIKLAIAVIATVISVQPANAAKYVLTYSGVKTDKSGLLIARLNIDTSNHAYSSGGYAVTSVGGTTDGESVAGILGNPNTPGTNNARGFQYDNIFFSDNPVFNAFGLAFTTATNSWNLWGTAPDAYTLMKFTPGRGYSGATDGTLQVAAIPEPASWALLIAGFGMVGVAARRRTAMVAA